MRFEANDIDWAHGSGPTVSGSAKALLLAITGRTTAFGPLSGDGVSTLRARVSQPTRYYFVTPRVSVARRPTMLAA